MSARAERAARQDGAPAGAEEGMPLLAHLDELRHRLVRAAIGVAIAFAVCYWQVDQLMEWVKAPLREVEGLEDLNLSVFTISEGFFIQLRVAFIAAIFLSAPWTLTQAWEFIRPGLHEHERRLAIPFVLFASLFFLAGGAFGYFIGFPVMNDYLLGTAAQGFDKSLRAETYVSTLSSVLLGMGLVFEAPVLTWFLARMELVSAGWLLRKLRPAIVVMAILAALITPSGDIPTMVVFTTPMLALYAVSIGVAWAARPRRSPSRDES